MDLVRHFKTQWIPLRNKETAQGRSFEKVLILKQAHVLGSQCIDLISGATFSEPSLPQSHSLFNKAVFLMCHWTTEDLFRITMQCFKSLDTMELVFQQCMSLYSTIQCLQPVHGQQDTFAEQKMHPSTQQNSGLKLSMNILRTLTSNRLPYDKAVLETSRWASV
ncbi:hypothetical protein TNCT_566041 [Trichonephila clavata]|uniref:Uncharacterized protein n=1 Tax=Trichonephila clavata TaxID=2740835 RepID=A0A8X6KE20_TRICU|nr:hypothetical protein TNCT_566041 [Trichonephila clavata]